MQIGLDRRIEFSKGVPSLDYLCWTLWLITRWAYVIISPHTDLIIPTALRLINFLLLPSMSIAVFSSTQLLLLLLPLQFIFKLAAFLPWLHLLVLDIIVLVFLAIFSYGAQNVILSLIMI